MSAIERLESRMQPGDVCRRAELVRSVKNLDRDLRELVEAGELWKL